MSKVARAETRRKNRDKSKLNVTYNRTELQLRNEMVKAIKQERDTLWKQNALDWYLVQLWIMRSRFKWGKIDLQGFTKK